LDPIKIVIENYPEDKIEYLKAAFNPQDPESESRELPFSRELYIERSDFMEEPAKKYFRLAPGAEVRLRHSYVIKCNQIIKNEQGDIIELLCSYDEKTLGKNPEDRKVKGVIHWVSCAQAYPVTIYQYDRLFNDPNPAREDDFMQFLNHDSLQTLQGYCEPAMSKQQEGDVFQFERLGYYCVNQVIDGKVTAFHRIVDLKDTWGKIS
ncbi:MAG: glutamine--tRNA ligase, partial [bacterium]|nr:glutamine--tRNA ligase [bacterium]